MKDIFLITQIVSGIVLSILILLQVRGTGFGRVWGNLGTSFTRRGLEGLVFKMTFIVAFLFMLFSTFALVI